MVQFTFTEKSKNIHRVMKDFKVVPFKEVEKTLDEASRKAFSNKKCEKDEETAYECVDAIYTQSLKELKKAKKEEKKQDKKAKKNKKAKENVN